MFIGTDASNSAKYHPFYITDSSQGGFGQKTNEEKAKEHVFAGIGPDGKITNGSSMTNTH